MAQRFLPTAARTLVAWVLGLLVAFPLIWMAMTAFKTEMQAISIPPQILFKPTLHAFASVQAQSDYLHYARNSAITAGLSTLLGLLIAAPASYSMAFFRTRRTRDLLMWMLSTKMMPAVGALVPVYLIARWAHALDSLTALTLLFMLMNLPIMVWLLYSSFKEIPNEILEAVRMDGGGTWHELRYVVLPLSVSGISSTGLLALVMSWNESFWSINLASAHAGTLATMIASFSSPEGLFWAKLSAASLLAVAPIIVLGWMSQKQLVSGLTFGAVK